MGYILYELVTIDIHVIVFRCQIDGNFNDVSSLSINLGIIMYNNLWFCSWVFSFSNNDWSVQSLFQSLQSKRRFRSEKLWICDIQRGRDWTLIEMVLNQKLEIPSTRELIKITFNRSQWNSRTPLQKWYYLYGIGRTFLIPTGYKVFEEDQTLPWYSYFTPAYITVYFLLAIYTSFHYTSQGEFVKFLPCTCLLGIISSVRFSFAYESSKYHK